MMSIKTNTGIDEIEAVLNRQIQLADQIRTDMRNLITASFAEAIHPVLDDAKEKIGKSIADATEAINEFQARVEVPLAEVKQKLDTMQTDILNNSDIQNKIAGNNETHKAVLDGQIQEMGKMLRSQRNLSWVVMLLCGSALSLLLWLVLQRI